MTAETKNPQFKMIQITKLHPTFGAEVAGVDFSRPIPDLTFGEILDAMAQYGVCVFRNTGMDDKGHVEFSRRFGDLDDIKPYLQNGRKPRYAYYELFDAGNVDEQGNVLTPDSPRSQYNKGNGLFHVDSSFNPRRASYSILRAETLPPSHTGGNTDFADTRTAFAELPEDLKKTLIEKDYVVAHSIHHSRKVAAPEYFKDLDPTKFRMAKHRLVQCHEPSGRMNLYIATHGHHVEGLSPEQSAELLRTLMEHCTQEKYTFSVEWKQSGDIIIWDNTAVIHRAGKFAGGYLRDMRRTTVHDASSTAWGLNEVGELKPAFSVTNMVYDDEIPHSLPLKSHMWGKFPEGQKIWTVMSSTGSDVVIPQTSVRANWKCMVIACVVATANMQYGFDTAVVGSFQAMPGFLKVFGFVDPSIKIGYGIDPTFQQLITSLVTLGSFVSSFTAGFFGNYFGRKHALWLACCMNFVGLTVQIATTNKGVIYLGRFLLGLSNGFLVTFSNIYTSEIAPAHLRGVMVAFFTFWVNIGSLVGSIINYYSSTVMDKRCYIIPLATLYIVPVVLCIGLFFVPESPRWLLYKNKEKQGRKALQTLRGGSIDEEYIEIEWAEMVRGLEQEKFLVKSTDWMDMYRGTNLRRTILCYSTMASHASSGIWFSISYGTYFLQIAGVSQPFLYTIMTLCIGMVGTLTGMYVIRDMLGRRFIFIFSSIACALSFAIIGIAGVLQTKENSHAVGKALVASGAILGFFYNSGIGLVSYPVGTEVVSSRLRAWTVGSAISLGYLLAWLVAFFSPYFINPKKLNWGMKYGWIWTGSNIICAVFFYFFLPETKGRTLEEIDELFENCVSVKGFSTYHTKIGEDAVHDIGQHHAGEKEEDVPVYKIGKPDKVFSPMLNLIRPRPNSNPESSTVDFKVYEDRVDKCHYYTWQKKAERSAKIRGRKRGT
ncbi:hypothetical protein G7Y89_g13583 [Cudoniella acicularis]|uniref:Major facilitator superfamily (MFS) profile domain-containing protein n=1 Tax=Cudoniella acicularis TaxID=354080 RepID=A0A8H4R906_9HELO|nr:hypothetical protein G7Y89_g13583 [Cudoniella acicularis]